MFIVTGLSEDGQKLYMSMKNKYLKAIYQLLLETRSPTQAEATYKEFLSVCAEIKMVEPKAKQKWQAFFKRYSFINVPDSVRDFHS